MGASLWHFQTNNLIYFDHIQSSCYPALSFIPTGPLVKVNLITVKFGSDIIYTYCNKDYY